MSMLSFIIDVKDRASSALKNIKSGFENLRAQASGIGGAVVGALSVTAIGSFAKSVLDYVGNIKDASAATGISVERFQALSIAAKQNGVDVGTLTGSIARLQNIQGNIGKDKNLQDAFSKLGISVADVQQQNPEQLLEGIAKGLKSTGDSSIAFDIFGRGAASMLTTMNELADGWDNLVSKMRQGIISEEDIERIDEMGDTLDRAMVQIKAWAAQGVGKLADASAFYGKLAAGENWEKALVSVEKDKQAERDQKKKEKESREAARKASMKEASERQFQADVSATKEETYKLYDQKARLGLSDKELEVMLQAKVNNLIAASNEEGLDALEKQKRVNDALKVTIELLTLQKKLKDESDRKTESDKKLIDDAQKRSQKYLEAQKTPEEQLKEVEARLTRTKPMIMKEQDSGKRAALINQQTDDLEAKDRLKGIIKQKADERASREESLMDRDRNLREARMTPAQRIAESQKRQGDLERQLKTEADPDKRLGLREKIAIEQELRAGLEKDKPGRRSMGIGDVFEKMYDKKLGKKDPVAEQVEISKDIRTLLKKIADKPGGMAA